jgi:hypothetical protein
MIKTELVIFIGPLQATGAIIKKRFVTAAGAVAGAGANVAGVAGDDAAVGETFPVKARGWLIVESGAAVAQGDDVQSDATGRAITQAAGKHAGRALDAATAAGQPIRIDR